MNPFTQIYDGLWRLVNRNPELNKILLEGNRIRFDHVNPMKENISENDLPELMLIHGTTSANIRNSSGTSSITKNYIWCITTNDFSLSRTFDVITWELYRSMVDWDIVLCALEYPAGWHYVTKATTIEASDGLSNSEYNRGLEGWTGLWTVEVECHFNTQSLRIKEEFNNASP